MLYRCASGDLIRPAHNNPYQRPGCGYARTAVPLFCGQLGSGVGWLAAPLPYATYAPVRP